MSLIDNSYLEKKIKIWYKEKFQKKIDSISLLSGGQSNLCYLINNNYVLKVYKPKYSYAKKDQEKYFDTAREFQPKLNKSGFTPKITQVYVDDDILEANVILMEYIAGKDLSITLSKCSEDFKFNTGQEIGSILKAIYQSETISNQSYNTQELLDTTKRHLAIAIERGVIPQNILIKSQEYIDNYIPRNISEDFVLVHGDAHLENFIKQQSKLFVIDFDLCSMALAFFETRMLLHLAFMPANLVSEELEIYYPEGSMLILVSGVIESYPEILPHKYFSEIKLIALTEILGKFDLDESVVDRIIPIRRASFMFDQIFNQSALENLLNH
ncbi:MAG: aminoglycoside phosphotransferase family protein [Patescibacteria group bacterium]